MLGLRLCVAMEPLFLKIVEETAILILLVLLKKLESVALKLLVLAL